MVRFAVAISAVLTMVVPFAQRDAVGQSIVALGLDPALPERQFYAIDAGTGVATQISPSRTGFNLPGMAASPTGQYFGLSGNVTAPKTLVEIDTAAGTLRAIGDTGKNLAGFDIMDNGSAFAVSWFPNPQVFSIDLSTATTTAVTQPDTLANAVAALGGATTPLTFGGLGSVGNVLFASETARGTLLSIDPATGSAHVVGGAIGLLNAGELRTGIARARYSGFAALTGFDSDRDGHFDTLLGSVNLFDDDNDPATPSVSIGGLAQFDLQTSAWELVGTNPGVQFSSFASYPVPEPSSWVMVTCGLMVGAMNTIRRREKRSAK